jgi:hypothetical protein
LRNAPEIHFKADESLAHASRIEQLLAQIRTDRDATADAAANELAAEDLSGPSGPASSAE